MPSDQDRVAAGVAQSNKLAPVRDARGRLLPGSTANRNGRPRGSINSTTKLAARRAQAGAARRVKRLEEMAADADPYLALQAIRVLDEIGRKAPEDSTVPGPEYFTADEERKILKLLARARRRRDEGRIVRTFEHLTGTEPAPHPASEFQGIPAAAEVIDVQPLVIPLKTEAQ